MPDWSGDRTQSFRSLPDELLEEFRRVVPRVNGYHRRTFIALMALITAPDCPPEAHRVLWDWVDRAHRDPAARRPETLATDFARAVIDYGKVPATEAGDRGGGNARRDVVDGDRRDARDDRG